MHFVTGLLPRAIQEMEFNSQVLSIIFARQYQGQGNELGLARPLYIGTDTTVAYIYQQSLIPPMATDKTQSLSKPPCTETDTYDFGLHSFWDGVRFLVFSILTLISVAIMLVVGSFFVIGLIFFPFAEISTGFAKSKSHWHRFTAFFGHLFNKFFQFVDGLWD